MIRVWFGLVFSWVAMGSVLDPSQISHDLPGLERSFKEACTKITSEACAVSALHFLDVSLFAKNAPEGLRPSLIKTCAESGEGTRSAVCQLAQWIADSSSLDQDDVTAVLHQWQDIPLPDRLYLEARLFIYLSSFDSRWENRAITSLRFLQKLQPALSVTDFWLGYLEQRQGNLENAKAHFTSALMKNPQDAWVPFFFNPVDKSFLPIISKPTESSLRVGLLGDSVLGVGGELLYFHPFSSAEAFRISGGLRHTGNYDLALKFLREPEESLGNVIWADYRHRWQMNRFRVGVAGLVALGRFFQTQLGMDIVHIASPLLDYQALGGPRITLKWSSLDSDVDPRNGTWTSLSGFFPFPIHGMQSRLSEYRVDGGLLGFVQRYHGYRLAVAGRWLTGEVAEDWYPRVDDMEGVRGISAASPSTQLEGGSLEYINRFLAPLTLHGFVSVLGSDGNFPLPALWRGGAGVAIEFRKSHARGEVARLELARFADQWVFQALAGREW